MGVSFVLAVLLVGTFGYIYYSAYVSRPTTVNSNWTIAASYGCPAACVNARTYYVNGTASSGSATFGTMNYLVSGVVTGITPEGCLIQAETLGRYRLSDHPDGPRRKSVKRLLCSFSS